MEKNLLGMPPIMREGQAISTHCLQECQGIAMRAEIERLRAKVERLEGALADVLAYYSMPKEKE